MYFPTFGPERISRYEINGACVCGIAMAIKRKRLILIIGMRYRVILLYTESKMTMKLIRMQLTKRQKIVEILMHLVCQSILMDINRHTIYHIKSIFRIVIARDRSNCIFIESSSTVAKPKKITFVDERSKTSCRFEARLKPIDQPRKKQLHVRSRIQPEGEFIKLPLKFSFTRQFTSSRFLRGCTDSLRREFFPCFKSRITDLSSKQSPVTENEITR